MPRLTKSMNAIFGSIHLLHSLLRCAGVIPNTRDKLMDAYVSQQPYGA